MEIESDLNSNLLTQVMQERFMAVRYRKREILHSGLDDSFRAALKPAECQGEIDRHGQDPFDDAATGEDDPFAQRRLIDSLWMVTTSLARSMAGRERHELFAARTTGAVVETIRTTARVRAGTGRPDRWRNRMTERSGPCWNGSRHGPGHRSRPRGDTGSPSSKNRLNAPVSMGAMSSKLSADAWHPGATG